MRRVDQRLCCTTQHARWCAAAASTIGCAPSNSRDTGRHLAHSKAMCCARPGCDLRSRSRVDLSACDAHIAHRCGGSIPATAATADDRCNLLCVNHTGHPPPDSLCKGMWGYGAAAAGRPRQLAALALAGPSADAAGAAELPTQAAFSPTSCERALRTMVNQLGSAVDWAQEVPWLMPGCNCSPQSSTGLAPTTATPVRPHPHNFTSSERMLC
jgi:hypothetical protein